LVSAIGLVAQKYNKFVRKDDGRLVNYFIIYKIFLCLKLDNI